jgi:hypothetical protein
MAKQEMHRFIRNNPQREDLTRFTFSEKQYAALDWEENHEFNFEGQVYDVITVKTSGNQVVVHCIADIREQELTRAYHEQQQNQQSRDLVNIFKLINACFSTTGYEIEAPLKSARDPYSDYNCPPATKGESAILTPPPDAC